MQMIALDFSRKDSDQVLLAKQGDVGRKVCFQFTDNGTAFRIPDDALFSVWYCGTSGAGNYTQVGEKSAFQVSDDRLQVELIAQMLSVRGGGAMCLVMNREDGSSIGSWNIPYTAEPLPGADSQEATAYYSAFSEFVAKTKEYMDRAEAAAERCGSVLSLSGGVMEGAIDMDGNPITGISNAENPMDALPIGQASELFAPAGGYCGSKSISSMEALGTAVVQMLEAMNVNQRKVWNISILGIPAGFDSSLSGAVTVTKLADGLGVLEFALFDVNHTVYYATASMYNNSLYPLCWENPPMKKGVEYKTAQMYLNRPVYQTVIHIGALPNNSKATIPHGIEKIDRCIDLAAANDTGSVCMGIGYPGLEYLYASSSNILVKTTSDLSTISLNVILKYLKNGD